MCAVQLVARLRVCGATWRPLALSMQLCGDLETWHFDWPRSDASAAVGSVSQPDHVQHHYIDMRRGTLLMEGSPQPQHRCVCSTSAAQEAYCW